MYIPCQIVDLSSLESQASFVQFSAFCCPCPSRHHREERRQSNTSRYHDWSDDPELIFSRHRAVAAAGHRFLPNHAAIFNLQTAPALPHLSPPPLPPRTLSSFFPPMPPMPPRNGNPDGGESSKTKKDQRTFLKSRNSQKVAALPPPNVNFQNPVSPTPAASTSGIHCPYLSPIDVAKSSWEWDFAKDTFKQQPEWGIPSPSDPESGATNHVNMWGDPPVVMKGLLLQQREKMWSRWKERYFILTRDYLHCFRRLRNVYRFHITLSAMGHFIYKLRLANVEDIKWESRRHGSRISIAVKQEPRILLRSNDEDDEQLTHWFTLLQECICMSKIRRQALRTFTSSEDSSSQTDASRRSGHGWRSLNQDSNSSYTVATSATGDSSQTEILDIYPKFIESSRIKSGSKVVDVTKNEKEESGEKNGSFHLFNNPPPTGGRRHPYRKLFPLPALIDAESGEDADDILRALPKRCSNPTREIDMSSSSSNRTVSTLSDKKQALEKWHDGRISVVSGNMCRPESRVTLRDFVKSPWRSNSALFPPQHPGTPELRMRELRESNLQNSSRMSEFPIPTRRPPIPQRPMSSFSRPPPQGAFGGRKVLPTPWVKNPTLQIGKGPAWCRSNVIVCPSKLSADVTYLRRV